MEHSDLTAGSFVQAARSTAVWTLDFVTSIYHSNLITTIDDSRILSIYKLNI